MRSLAVEPGTRCGWRGVPNFSMKQDSSTPMGCSRGNPSSSCCVVIVSPCRQAHVNSTIIQPSPAKYRAEGPLKSAVSGAILYAGYGPHPSISNSECGTPRGQVSNLPLSFYKPLFLPEGPLKFRDLGAITYQRKRSQYRNPGGVGPHKRRGNGAAPPFG